MNNLTFKYFSSPPFCRRVESSRVDSPFNPPPPLLLIFPFPFRRNFLHACHNSNRQRFSFAFPKPQRADSALVYTNICTLCPLSLSIVAGYKLIHTKPRRCIDFLFRVFAFPENFFLKLFCTLSNVNS